MKERKGFDSSFPDLVQSGYDSSYGPISLPKLFPFFGLQPYPNSNLFEG